MASKLWPYLEKGVIQCWRAAKKRTTENFMSGHRSDAEWLNCTVRVGWRWWSVQEKIGS